MRYREAERHCRMCLRHRKVLLALLQPKISLSPFVTPPPGNKDCLVYKASQITMSQSRAFPPEPFTRFKPELSQGEETFPHSLTAENEAWYSFGGANGDGVGHDDDDDDGGTGCII